MTDGGYRAPTPLALLATVAWAVVLAAVPVAWTPAEAASDAAAVSGLSPVPGAVVGAGSVELRARLRSTDRIVSARFVLGDGQAVEATVGADDPGHGWPVDASAVLAPGDHAVRVEGQDTAGRRLVREWWITATDRSVRRFAGPSRIDTAVAASAAAFPDGGSAPAAVLARADDFADALAGVPLAAAVEGPLLLSSRGALPAATAAELQRVLRPGSKVHLLGGDEALGDAVVAAVADLGLATERHAGADRYATAAAVARALPASTGAVIASGTAFPDALSAAAPAAREGWPVLLTPAGGLAEPTAAALTGRGVTHAAIVGGAAAVSGAVEDQVRGTGADVTRIAGPDRYATAAAVAAAFYVHPTGVSLASGVDFPDALGGTRHAVLLDQPLLLTRPAALPAATAEVIRAHGPRRLDVYGGPAAVSDQTVEDAVRAAIDGPHAPRLLGSVPASAATVAALDSVTVRLDRPVDPVRSSVYVEVGGAEVTGALDAGGAPDTLTFRPHGGDIAGLDTPWPARVVVRAVTPDGLVGRHAATFTYLEPNPFYATAGDVALYLPSRGAAMIGFHESAHPGAQQQTPRPTAMPRTTLPTRNRGTGSHTAADIVASPELPVLAPVTGRVLRADSYVLYCRYGDEYAVIEPDARPGWEVTVMHVQGIRVRAGDRVVAHQTTIADAPRLLPFTSQVDRASATGWPHLHVEVVDPSVPRRPGGGC